MRSGTPFFPEVASTMARRVDALYLFLVGLTAFFSILIATLIVVFAVKYKRRSPNEIGARIHGGMALEIAWSVIPLFICHGHLRLGAGIFFAMARPPAETMNVYVVGKQWMWKFQHLDGQREINELHVPVGRPVKLIMTSEDVIHDVFVPGLPRQGRRHSRPLHAPVVRADQGRRVSPVLRGVLRHAPLRHDRQGRRDGAG